MALRKQAFERSEVRSDLLELVNRSKLRRVTEEELAEQRISFAFGNALNNEKITKESVRETAQSVRLKS